MRLSTNITRHHRGILLVLVGVVVGCGSSVPSVIDVSAMSVARSRAAIPTDPMRQAYTERGGFSEYIIGVGDKLRFTLRDLQVTKEEVSVRPDGNISFSMLENVSAAGRTPTELDDDVTERLSRFLRTPRVDVEVIEYHSKIVSLLGAIDRRRP
jgi:polysaccharide export outer membrane protein